MATFKKLVLLQILVAIFILGISSCSFADFTAYGYVYKSDGVSGDATSYNSLATARIFRRTIAAHIATSEKDFDYNVATGTDPANFGVDTYTPWSGAAVVAGQSAIVVVETVKGVNGYSDGLDYVGAKVYDILAEDIVHDWFSFSDISMQSIPTPELKSKTSTSITLYWTGVATSDSNGNIVNSVETFAVYRSSSPTGTFSYIGRADNVSGEVTYIDSTVSPGTNYYYKLKMSYAWPGSPPYYQTMATSDTSEGFSPSYPAPIVDGVSPTHIQNNGLKVITVSGNYFTNESITVFITREGELPVTAETGGVTIDSVNQVRAAINLNNIDIGLWSPTVATTLGTGAAYHILTVTSDAPAITNISPSAGKTNTSLTGVSITGSGFYVSPGPSVWLQIRKGSTVSTISATSVSANAGHNTITCDLALTNATIGTWDVYVRNGFDSQMTHEAIFTVTSDAPSITSITPPQGSNTTSDLHVTSLAGTNLFENAVIELRKTGQTNIVASNETVNAAHTSIDCHFNLSGAAVGSWDVYVRNSDTQEVTALNVFTVTAAPSISSITPATAENNASVSAVIRGSNFFNAPTVKLTKSGQSDITGTGAVIVSSREIDCTLPITNATIGLWNVVVSNSDGVGTRESAFLVTSEAPTISAIIPSSGSGGTTASVAITGSRFYKDATVQLRRTGVSTISASSSTLRNIGSIECSFILPINAEYVGIWDVYFANTDGQSTIDASAFTINYGTVEAPTNCSIETLGTTSMKITWKDNSLNEDLFRIERSANSSTYTEVGTAPANATSYTGSGTTSLEINTKYWFRVRAQAGSTYTSYSTSSPKYTFSATPAASSFGPVTSTSLVPRWTSAGNPAGTLYLCENTTNGTNSANTTEVSWTNTALTPASTYSYRVKSINGDAMPSSWISLGSKATYASRDLYSMLANGIKLFSGDIISATSKISVIFTSESAIDVSTFRFYINGVAVTDGTNTYYDTYTTAGTFTTFEYTIKNALSEGTYNFKGSASETLGTLFESQVSNLMVMAPGTKTVIGYTMMYPNPYDPTKGPVKIAYNMATDTDVTIYVFDVNGRFVWKENYLSGTNGGKAGYNEVLWSGYDSFNRILDNDVYLVRVVETSTGKVLGKSKVVVVKSVSSRQKTKEDRRNLFAGLMGGGNGGPGSFDFAKIFLFSLLGLIAFEEIMKMYAAMKSIKRMHM